MMGLLGTVVGMVGAFATMKESMDDATAMAADSVGLAHTTGLVVAIPSLFSYFLFKNSYGKIVVRLTKSLVSSFYSFSRAPRSTVKTPCRTNMPKTQARARMEG